MGICPQIGWNGKPALQPAVSSFELGGNAAAGDESAPAKRAGGKPEAGRDYVHRATPVREIGAGGGSQNKPVLSEIVPASITCQLSVHNYFRFLIDQRCRF
jgi:hypothetical protein